MRVRIARPNDAADTAWCLAEPRCSTAEELVLERLQKFSASINDNVLVAVDAGRRVMDVINAHCLPLVYVSGHMVRITALAVRQTAQGAGFGRMLVSAVGWRGQVHLSGEQEGDNGAEAIGLASNNPSWPGATESRAGARYSYP